MSIFAPNTKRPLQFSHHCVVYTLRKVTQQVSKTQMKWTHFLSFIIDNISLVLAWPQSGDKPLSEPMMALIIDAYIRHLASMGIWLAL